MEFELRYSEPVEIKANYKGITVDDVESRLSPKAAKAFRKIYQSLVDEPCGARRNRKYSDILDIAYTEKSSIFKKIDWRNERNGIKTVVLENCTEEIRDELMRLSLRISKRGRGGYVEESRFFSGTSRISAFGKNYYIFRFVLEILPNGNIVCSTDEQRAKMEQFLAYA